MAVLTRTTDVQQAARFRTVAGAGGKVAGRGPPHVGSVKNAAEVREIVLLGGSGDVGTRLARLLLQITGLGVTTVSRRPKEIADQSGGRLRHVVFDLSGRKSFATSANVIVVNLTEATPPSFARQVIDTGGWFLETSATSGYLGAIRDALKRAAGPGSAVLCVGTAPGLTNLMAAEIVSKAPETVQIDIGIEMGMGRHYGFAATEWFLRTAGQRYPVVIDHAVREVMPGQLKRRFVFREGGPLRDSVGYGFAEQTLIAEGSDQELKTVRSFVALDPAWIGRAFALSLSIGLGPAIGRNARRLARWLLRTPVIGRTRSRLVVEGFDAAGQLTGQIRLETGDQAEATAAVIFAMIQSLSEHRDRGRPGVTAITDHLHLDAAIEELRRVLPETRVSASFGRDNDSQTATGK